MTEEGVQTTEKPPEISGENVRNSREKEGRKGRDDFCLREKKSKIITVELTELPKNKKSRAGKVE